MKNKENQMMLKKGLENNLKLIMENSISLRNAFKNNEAIQDMMESYFLIASTYLIEVHDGKWEGKERELFDIFLPICMHLNQQWHLHSMKK